MHRNLKIAPFVKKRGANILIFLVTVVSSGGIYSNLALSQEAEVGFEDHLQKGLPIYDSVIIQENSLKPLPSHIIVTEEEIKAARRINVLATGYSSCPFETDATPFITASGSRVKDGTVAINTLPFGTKIRIPELYGDKIFIVEDRMNAAAGRHVDVWFPSKEEALFFGKNSTYIEVF